MNKKESWKRKFRKEVGCYLIAHINTIHLYERFGVSLTKDLKKRNKFFTKKAEDFITKLLRNKFNK